MLQIGYKANGYMAGIEIEIVRFRALNREVISEGSMLRIVSCGKVFRNIPNL